MRETECFYDLTNFQEDRFWYGSRFVVSLFQFDIGVDSMFFFFNEIVGWWAYIGFRRQERAHGQERERGRESENGT